MAQDWLTDLLECDDDGLSFTQEYIILYLRNIADSQICWRTPKFSNLGVLLTPKKSGSKSTPARATVLLHWLSKFWQVVTAKQDCSVGVAV